MGLTSAMTHPMKPVSQARLAHLAEMASPRSEVIPMDWADEDEDHHIAVFIDDRETPAVQKRVSSA